MRRSLALVAGLAVAAGAAFVTAVNAQDKPPIIIGQALDFSNWMLTYDGQPQRSMEIAVEDVNAAGGVLGGRMLELVKCDTKADREQGAKCGAEVVQAGAKMAAFSCDYDMGGPAALQFAQAGIVGISVCGSDPKIGVQGIGPYTFTMSTAANAQGYVLAEWGYSRKGWRRAYTLLDNSIEYDKSLCHGFEERWQELEGATLAGKDVFKQDDPSIAAQITKLKALDPQPEVLILCSYIPGGATALRQIRAAGIETPVLTSESYAGQFWFDSVPGLKNYYHGTHGNVYGPEAYTEEEKVFLEKYRKKFGEEPASDHVYLGYSMIQAYVKALEMAGTDDPAKVVEAMETFRDVPLLIGPTTWTKDTHIQVRRPFAFFEMADGKLKFIEKFAAEKAWDISKLKSWD
ncbi:MAG: ABC transporter substrate-binding protein [Alphaproteobacteria bacterium]|nr:ABC transporter substrate-binding protein [Alphaproteobacteria bacterium]